MSSSLMTGFMTTSPRLPAAATEATAAAAERACACRWRGRLGLRRFDGGDDQVAFLQAVGDFGKLAVADAGFDAHRLRNGHGLSAAGRRVRYQQINIAG